MNNFFININIIHLKNDKIPNYIGDRIIRIRYDEFTRRLYKIPKDNRKELINKDITLF